MAKSLATRSNLLPEEVEKFLEAFTELMIEHFKKGEKVVIADLGSFYLNQDGSIQFNPSAKLKSQIE